MDCAPGPVQTIAFAPDGGRLAIASHSHDVKLYEVNRWADAPDEAEPQTIKVGPSRITAFAFSPDGKQLAIATSEGAAKVHDLTTDRQPMELGTQPFAIWSIVFEPDGRRMAAGSWDGTIKLWDAKSWELLQSVKKHEESVATMVFDGRQGLNSAGLDGRLLYWSPEIPSISPNGMIAGRDDSVWVAVYSPDGKRLFVGGRGNRFELWDAEQNKLLVSRRAILRRAVQRSRPTAPRWPRAATTAPSSYATPAPGRRGPDCSGIPVRSPRWSSRTRGGL